MKLTISVHLVRIVRDRAIVQMVKQSIVVHIVVTQITSAVAVCVQLIRVGYLGTIVLTILHAVLVAIYVTIARIAHQIIVRV